MSKYGEIHMHSMDRFDSQNDPEKICKKLSAMGAVGFCITQHGVLSVVDEMKAAAEKLGLKYIPGIEAYYDNGLNRCHLILIAMNYDGYRELSRAVTKANDKQGRAVFNHELLLSYFGPGTKGHGNIIATSACFQGVIAMKLRANETLEEEITRVKKARDNGIATDDIRLSKTEATVKQLEADLEKMIESREKLKKISSQKFAFREKSVNKMQDGPEKERERELLEADKKAAEDAAKGLEKIKSDIASTKKRITTLNNELTVYKEKAEIYKKYDDKLRELESAVKPTLSLREEAKDEALEFQRIFGENHFFIEVQNHRIPMEEEIYPVLAKIAEELNLPVVVTNDAHMVDGTPEERLQRQILRSLRFEKWCEENPGDAELYIKSDEELEKIVSEIIPAETVRKGLQNVRYIIDKCNVEFPKENHYPKYQDDGRTSEEILHEHIERGIREKFPEGLTEKYKARLEKELKVIEGMGYADYHLIVEDFLEYGRLLGYVPIDRLSEAPLTIEGLRKFIEENRFKPKFTIGPGRGSAVGSLVCYLLGITSLDPIKYDLLFERFLNVERVSMPDIDSDIANAIRPKVIEYVTNKYGKNAVCGIMTTNAQAPRGAIRIAGKYYGLSIGKDGYFLGLSDEMAKKVPTEPNTKFSSLIEKNGKEMTVRAMLEDDYKSNSDALEIIRWAGLIEGSFTTYGAHAAGIVISDNDDVSEYVPLRWNDNLGEWTTQCDMVAVEEKGLLKMDFLGLKTLDIITGTMKMLEKKGIEIDPIKLDINDKDVYKEIFQKGRTNSVFQFESNGMKNMLQRFRPECFEDLIILVSTFRPGPIQFLDDIINVKNGRKEPQYVTPELVPILGKTYGAIVYQEQVMQIFQDLAGYSLGAADNVRRYMSKKKMDKLAHERKAFIHGDVDRNIRGCVANGISEEAANMLFDQMSEFAKYAFNKSHAAAYAYNAYITGWLKYHYPAEFLASALNWATQKKIAGLMYEARQFGIKVRVPDINLAAADFTVVNGEIMFGMKAVKSVGKSAEEIMMERENGRFISLRDFFIRVKVKKDVVTNLIKAGAFDSFCSNRNAMISVIESYKNAVKKVKEAEEKYKSADDKTIQRLREKLNAARRSLAELTLPINMPEELSERLKAEKEYLGEYVTAHPLDEYPTFAEMGVTPIDDADGHCRIYGVIDAIDRKQRKSDGKDMAFITLNDGTGEMTVNFFTKQYANFKELLEEGNVIIITGEAREEETDMVDEEGNTVLIRKYYPNNVEIAKKKSHEYVMTVPSYAKFHLFQEDDFRKEYEKQDGNILIIHDALTGEIRRAMYRVSEQVKNLQNVN